MAMTDKNRILAVPAIAPSMLASNYDALGEEMLAMVRAGADCIHWDIMDGVYVPNTSFTSDQVRKQRPLSDIIFDVHLMVTDPDSVIDEFADAGADIITFHVDTCSDPRKVIEHIRSRGVLPSLALKPGEGIETVAPFLGDVFMCLAMTVEPGFGGQKFNPNVCCKIRAIRELSGYIGKDLRIEVDGGINNDTVREAASAGADVFVAGTALFRQEDYRVAVDTMRHSAVSTVRKEEKI